MKQIVIKLSKVILYGIFWFIQHLNKILMYTITLTLLYILLGCSTSKNATQIVERVKQDTLYLSNVQYDSIFIQNGHSQEYHPFIVTSNSTEIDNLLRVDTIRVQDVSIEYKYKLLRDTIYKVKLDSVPVIKEVEVTKQVKYIPWYYKLVNGVVILFFIYLIYRITKWKIHI